MNPVRARTLLHVKTDSMDMCVNVEMGRYKCIIGQVRSDKVRFILLVNCVTIFTY